MDNIKFSSEIVTLCKDDYIHLFFERLLKCNNTSVYLLRVDRYIEFPQTLGVLLKIRNQLWFTYIDAPSDEYGKGCQPLRVVNVDTRTKTVEIEFELAFDRIHEYKKERIIAHNFKQVEISNLEDVLRRNYGTTQTEA